MSGRRRMGVAILAIWMGAVGWHVQREYFISDAERLAQATRHLSPATHFYALRHEDGTVGTAYSRLDTLPDGLVLEDRLDADLPVPGLGGEMSSRGRVELDRSLRLESFTFEMDSQAGSFRSEGTLRADSLLELRVGEEGEEREVTEIRVDEPPVFQSAVPIRLAMAGDLVEGRRVEVPVLDPAIGATRSAEVKVGEHHRMAVADTAVLDRETGRWHPGEPDTLDVWLVEERYGEYAVERWVDAEGRVVEATTPFGFSMERLPIQVIQQIELDTEREGVVAEEEEADR